MNSSDSRAWILKYGVQILTDLVKMKGMGLFFQNRLGQSAGLGNPANQGGRRAARV